MMFIFGTIITIFLIIIFRHLKEKINFNFLFTLVIDVKT